MRMSRGFPYGSGQILGVLLAGTVIAASAPPLAAASFPSSPAPASHPELKIYASRYYALAPAQVTVYARLSGVQAGDLRFCHPGETWVTGLIDSSGNLHTLSRHDPTCHHDATRASIPTAFVKPYRFGRPGSYTCRLVLSTNDGRILQSNQITIVVR